MSFLENIRPFKVAYLTGFVPVLACGQQVGVTRADFAKVISEFDETWELTSAGLELSSKFKTLEERTEAIDNTFVALSNASILPMMPDYSAFGGIDWFGVYGDNKAEALFLVKRFYYIYLGVPIHVIMLNGYTKNHYWVAIRSQNVEVGAGKQDVIAAGSVRYGETIEQGLFHEASEEAGLTETDLAKAVFVHKIYLPNLSAAGFYSNETFYIFDLDLEEKVPKTNLEHEVAGFKLLTNEQFLSDAEDGSVFKEHINVVVADFLIRHGILDNKHPDFEEIKTLLYRPTE